MHIYSNGSTASITTILVDRSDFSILSMQFTSISSLFKIELQISDYHDTINISCSVLIIPFCFLGKKLIG
jgi:hypothetical protein